MTFERRVFCGDLRLACLCGKKTEGGHDRDTSIAMALRGVLFFEGISY